MPPAAGFPRFALLCIAALAACASEREPAQQLLIDIEAAVLATSSDASRYVPDELAAVQSQLGTLKASFDRQDYQAVLARAPALLGRARSLAGAAAQKKAAVMNGLNEQWTALSSSVPGRAAAIQARIGLLREKSNRPLARGVDLGAARSGLSEATALWSKALGAFANGNMEEAVATAQSVNAKLEALAGSLKMDLRAPGSG